MSDAQTAVVFPVSTQFGPRRGPFSRALAAAGEWLRIHAKTIRVVQWFVVAAYVFLIAVPAFLPLPTEEAHWYNSLAVLAQWLFWGVWWPFVILSMLVVGRAWCGLFCPEGTLTEAVSKFGLGRAVPHWMKWNGWPFVAFALTTVFGQLVSVYQYPTATLARIGWVDGRCYRCRPGLRSQQARLVPPSLPRQRCLFGSLASRTRAFRGRYEQHGAPTPGASPCIR